MNEAPQPTTPKTVKVRIAVVVNDKGQWDASGNYTQTGSEAIEWALPGIDADSECTVAYFIEAEIPVPVPVVIQTEVKLAQEETL